MDLNGLREALRRQPFEPFEICLADGRSLPVRHPEVVAVGQRRAVVIQEDDSCHWLEPLLIVSLQWPAERTDGKKKNGKAKRKNKKNRDD
jgi:hypothetical protein